MEKARTAGLCAIDRRLRSKPKEGLSSHDQRHARVGQPATGPGAGRDHESAGGVTAARRFDRDAARLAAKIHNRFIGRQCGTRLRKRRPDGRAHIVRPARLLRAARRLRPAAPARQSQASDVRFLHRPERSISSPCCAALAMTPDTTMPSGRAYLQQPCLTKQWHAAATAQLGPQRVRPQHQGNVVGMLEVGLADQTRLTVRAAPIVCRRELIEPQHPRAAPGQGRECGAADRRRCPTRSRRMQPSNCFDPSRGTGHRLSTHQWRPSKHKKKREKEPIRAVGCCRATLPGPREAIAMRVALTSYL